MPIIDTTDAELAKIVADATNAYRRACEIEHGHGHAGDLRSCSEVPCNDLPAIETSARAYLESPPERGA